MKVKEIWMGILALVVIIAFILDGYLIMSGTIKTADPQLLLLIGSVFGASQTYTGVVLSYYFGNTKGSEDKNVTIATAIDKIPPAPSTTVTSTVTTPSPKPSP
jgi:hypothetical protein